MRVVVIIHAFTAQFDYIELTIFGARQIKI